MPIKEEMLKESSQKNQQLFLEFINYLYDVDHKKINSVEQYESTIINLYKYFSHQDIDGISLDIIEQYLLQNESLSTFSTKKSHLKKFFEFLQNAGISLSFSFVDINISFSNKEIQENIKRKPIPLTLEDIAWIRANIGEFFDPKLLYTFELVYLHGLKYEELQQCFDKYYDPSSRSFHFKKQDVKLHDRIFRLIELEPSLLKRSYNKSAFEYRISEIGELLGRDLLWKDIIKTREVNFISCPFCNTLYDRNAENWVIFEYSMDHSKWIVCRECGLKGGHHEQSSSF